MSESPQRVPPFSVREARRVLAEYEERTERYLDQVADERDRLRAALANARHRTSDRALAAEGLVSLMLAADPVRSLCREAIRLFGAEQDAEPDGVFNSASFGVALAERAGLTRAPDGKVVEAVLAGRYDIEVLSGGAHFRLKEKTELEQEARGRVAQGAGAGPTARPCSVEGCSFIAGPDGRCSWCRDHAVTFDLPAPSVVFTDAERPSPPAESDAPAEAGEWVVRVRRRAGGFVGTVEMNTPRGRVGLASNPWDTPVRAGRAALALGELLRGDPDFASAPPEHGQRINDSIARALLGSAEKVRAEADAADATRADIEHDARLLRVAAAVASSSRPHPNEVCDCGECTGALDAARAIRATAIATDGEVSS